jgi:arginine/ornithine N-succinyltransferase beta subunit
VKQSRFGQIAEIVERVDEPQTLIANSSRDFRACLGHVLWRDDGTAVLDQVTALQLEVRTGDRIRSAELRPGKEP